MERLGHLAFPETQDLLLLWFRYPVLREQIIYHAKNNHLKKPDLMKLKHSFHPV